MTTSHYSLKSCEGYPVTDFGNLFACGEREAAYLVTFEIAPHGLYLFKGKILDQSNFWSLTKVLTVKCKVNSYMCWLGIGMLIKWSRGISDHGFLSHAEAEAVHGKLESVCEDLHNEKLPQLSMDYRSVNWKMFRLMQEDVDSSL